MQNDLYDFCTAITKQIGEHDLTNPIANSEKILRFHIKSHKAGSKNGAYILFYHPNGFMAGCFWNWKTGEKK